MVYYHCSPTGGLTILKPQKPKIFEKPPAVYMTTLLPMALMYGIRNYEYSYGYTKSGQIYFDEYFPDALKILYLGKRASLYLCDPKSTSLTKIPNEVISNEAVPIVKEIVIPDVYKALLEQEKLGTLIINRYSELTAKSLKWIRNAEADTIKEHNLLSRDDPMADYYKTHYPESWSMVINGY